MGHIDMTKVITYGTYDLLHYGHKRLLERAKALGDYLFVGVTADNFDKNRGKINVQQSLMERIEGVKATGLADEIIIEEYEGQKILAEAIESKFGIDVVIPERDERYYLGDSKFEKTSYNVRETNLRLDIYEMLTYLKLDMEDVSKVVKSDVKHGATEEEMFEIKMKLVGLKEEMEKIKNRVKIEDMNEE